MKNKSSIATLLFAMALAGLCGCATESHCRPKRPTAFVAPNLQLAELGKIGIISSSTYPEIIFPTPGSRREAMENVRQNMGWGQNNDRALEACAAAGPGAIFMLSGFAAVTMTKVIVCDLPILANASSTGIPGETLVAAHAALNKVECTSPLQNGLRAELVGQLQQVFPGQIQLVAKPLPADADERFVRSVSVRQGTLGWLPKGETAQQYLTRQGIDTVLEIQLEYPSLKGSSSCNPSLQLCVDGRVVLRRVRDGVELASLPFSYSGSKARFTEWGKEEARQLRAEIQSCCRAVADDLSRQLAAQIRTAGPDSIQLAAAPRP
jgi:hypothetical protein